MPYEKYQCTTNKTRMLLFVFETLIFTVSVTKTHICSGMDRSKNRKTNGNKKAGKIEKT